MYRHLPYIILLMLITGCTEKSVENKEVLASVGKAELTLSKARNEIPNSLLIADSIKAFSDYRDKWIEEQLLLQEAKRLGFDNNEFIKSQIKKMESQIILNNFQDLIIGLDDSFKEVSTEEARLYYQDNKEKFVLSERYIRFRHFVGETRENAENARNDLLRGHTWENVLNKYGLYKTLKLNEAENYYPESVALDQYKTLSRYLSIIGINEVSLIERIDNNYHFVQLLEEKASGEHLALDWLIPQIQEWLTIEKKRRSFNTYLQNLYLAGRANNEIKIYDILLKSNTNSVETDTLNTN